jgi:hypothetical protein
MVGPMASESTRTITATTDSKDEHEQAATPDPHGPQQPAEELTEATGTGTSDTPDSPRATGGFAAGAAAVVSAGLGLSSLTGTGLGDMMRSRQEIIGQIQASVGGGAGIDQVEAFYGAPWHTAALLNGIFALLAVLTGGMLLAAHAQRPDTRSWVKSVALAGVVLGGIGVLLAGGMYFDLFAAQPVLPQAPSLGG